LVAQQELLEVGVVENVGVQGPSCGGTLLVVTTESKCEGTHESNELLGSEVCLGNTLHYETASISLSTVLNGVTLSLNVLSSALEDHGGTTTVLDSCIATKLEKVSLAEPVRDVVASLHDLLNLLDSEAELLALSNCKLVL